MLMAHSYGSESPFLTVHTLVELVSELHYSTAGLALSTQSLEQEQHTVFLRNALASIDKSLTEMLYNFTNEIDRYEPLSKLLAQLKEAKVYIDLNLGGLVEKSQTYRRASRQQKRFLATATVAVFASKKVLAGAMYALCGVVAGLAIWRWLTSKERKLCTEMSEARRTWADAIGLNQVKWHKGGWFKRLTKMGTKGGLCYRCKNALQNVGATLTRKRCGIQDLLKYVLNGDSKGTFAETGTQMTDLHPSKWDPDDWK